MTYQNGDTFYISLAGSGTIYSFTLTEAGFKNGFFKVEKYFDTKQIENLSECNEVKEFLTLRNYAHQTTDEFTVTSAQVVAPI